MTHTFSRAPGASSAPSKPPPRDTRTFRMHGGPSRQSGAAAVRFASSIASFVSFSTTPSRRSASIASAAVLLLVAVTAPSAPSTTAGHVSAVRTLPLNSARRR